MNNKFCSLAFWELGRRIEVTVRGDVSSLLTWVNTAFVQTLFGTGWSARPSICVPILGSWQRQLPPYEIRRKSLSVRVVTRDFAFRHKQEWLVGWSVTQRRQRGIPRRLEEAQAACTILASERDSLLKTMHRVKAMSWETWDTLDSANVLIANLRASLHQENLWAKRSDDRVPECNQQIAFSVGWLTFCLTPSSTSMSMLHLQLMENVDVLIRSLLPLSIPVYGCFAGLSTVWLRIFH